MIVVIILNIHYAPYQVNTRVNAFSGHDAGVNTLHLPSNKLLIITSTFVNECKQEVNEFLPNECTRYLIGWNIFRLRYFSDSTYCNMDRTLSDMSEILLSIQERETAVVLATIRKRWIRYLAWKTRFTMDSMILKRYYEPPSDSVRSIRLIITTFSYTRIVSVMLVSKYTC